MVSSEWARFIQERRKGKEGRGDDRKIERGKEREGEGRDNETT